MGVCENSDTSDTPKSPIFIGFSIINHPFWDATIFGNTQMDLQIKRQMAASFKVLSSTKRLLWSSKSPKKFRPNFGEILLMVQKIRRSPVEVGTLSRYLRGFIRRKGGAGFP